MKIEMFTGGLFVTNAYLAKVDDGWLAIDAPEGFCEFLQARNVPVKALVLTHGHPDHMWDAAEIMEWAKCPVYYHKDDDYLITHPEVLKTFGLPFDLQPVKSGQFLKEGDVFEVAPFHFNILHTPGHCPGSICLYEEKEGLIFDGDVLMAGGLGRYDLPGGSREELLRSVHEKLLTLPDKTVVYPGHGAKTTIGQEKRSNPYLE